MSGARPARRLLRFFASVASSGNVHSLCLVLVLRARNLCQLLLLTLYHAGLAPLRSAAFFAQLLSHKLPKLLCSHLARRLGSSKQQTLSGTEDRESTLILAALAALVHPPSSPSVLSFPISGEQATFRLKAYATSFCSARNLTVLRFSSRPSADAHIDALVSARANSLGTNRC